MARAGDHMHCVASQPVRYPTVAVASNLDVLLRAQACTEPTGEDGAARNMIAAVLALDAFAVRA